MGHDKGRPFPACSAFPVEFSELRGGAPIDRVAAIAPRVNPSDGDPWVARPDGSKAPRLAVRPFSSGRARKSG